MRFKKIIKYVLLISFVFLLGYFFKLVRYGSIDLDETLNTKYYDIENSDYQIVGTRYFDMKILKSWIHIFNGYGNEANAVGLFETRWDVVNYEYSDWAPNYENEYPELGYKIKYDTIGRFKVCIVVNKNNETGIYINKQYEMEYPFSFYMSKSVTENYGDIVVAIKELKFK